MRHGDHGQGRERDEPPEPAGVFEDEDDDVGSVAGGEAGMNQVVRGIQIRDQEIWRSVVRGKGEGSGRDGGVLTVQKEK